MSEQRNLANYHMEQQLDRKKYLNKLDKEAWEKVTTFVNDYFRNSEKADKATYKILFRAISEQYPNIVWNRKSFTRNVASIEELKGRAGIQIPTERLSKDHGSRLKDRFPPSRVFKS
jgi:hypothetical protein